VADLDSRLINRELSWLEFDQRVLALAADRSAPPLERAKFLAIFSGNLDEFFQVRVAGLREQVDASVRQLSPEGMTPVEQLAAVGRFTQLMSRRADGILRDELMPVLAEAGIGFAAWSDLDSDDRDLMREFFDRSVFPVLTPLAVDPAHPFPYISSLSLNLAVVVRDPSKGERRFARVKVPPLLPRFVMLADGERFLPLEQLIGAHLDRLFPGMAVEDQVAFRVTRNADLELEEDEAEDLLAAIEEEVRRRRFGRAVRLEVETGVTEEILGLLQRELDLTDDDTYFHDGLIDLSGFWSVHALDRPDLRYPGFSPQTQRALTDDDGRATDILGLLRHRDILVHHPYDSFSTSVEEFISQASVDPNVLAIKQTLYRTSGDSPIVDALIRAAESGKQAVALVELRARFDESSNIEWARHLEQSGVHVVYGLVGLKTHAKISLVARAEGDLVRRYCHLGTGNYHNETARLYEDMGLLTSDEQIGADVSQLFNFLTGFGRQVDYEKLLVAPDHMRNRLVDLIRQERTVPGGGSIRMKMNSLVDPTLIDELYAASQVGVRVELIVRGICCLRPQVEGLSDNITVRSIVGRYLEHSRVFWFSNGRGSGHPLVLIGSADLMPRNLDRRVETLVPVDAPELQDRIDGILSLNLVDDALAWELVDDRWMAPERGGSTDTHLELEARAIGSQMTGG